MIQVDGICKKFGREVVLDRLSLTVEKGELFVLLGANGAGKTTLLRCLAGLYVPYEGTITVDGLDRRRDHLEIRRFTAWLPDHPLLQSSFSGRGWLELVADLYGVDEETRDLQVVELLDVFDLQDIAGRRIVTYSNGQRKKLAICATLVTNAHFYLMDEPFTGEIDPPGLAALKEILREMRRRDDVTVVLSTQLVELAEHLASRVGILYDGRIVACGTTSELCDRFDATSLEDVLNKVVDRRPQERARGFLDLFAKRSPRMDEP